MEPTTHTKLISDWLLALNMQKEQYILLIKPATFWTGTDGCVKRNKEEHKCPSYLFTTKSLSRVKSKTMSYESGEGQGREGCEWSGGKVRLEDARVGTMHIVMPYKCQEYTLEGRTFSHDSYDKEDKEDVTCG